jgi:hypothetical protein
MSSLKRPTWATPSCRLGHPRRFVLDERGLLAATPGQLMVAPELHGREIGVALVQTFL